MIVGYGKMGKLIHQLCENYSMQVVKIIDPTRGTRLKNEDLDDIDLAFEFTNPTVVTDNLTYLISHNIKTVTGTTGWFDSLTEIEKLVTESNGSLIYGSNYSIGMNLFYHIIENAARMIGSIPEYDCWGLEKHHQFKIDSPSGTAKVISKIILDNIEQKTTAQYDKVDRKIKPEEFHFASVRSGRIPGEHSIGFDSEADSIEIKHTARNRNGLALGAIKAGLWILDKEGLFDFKDIFKDIVNN